MSAVPSPTPMSRSMRIWLQQVVNELLTQFTTSILPSIKELEDCGEGTIIRIRHLTAVIAASISLSSVESAQNRIIVALKSPRRAQSAPASPTTSKADLPPVVGAAEVEAARAELQQLQDQAFENMTSVHHSEVKRFWLRLYTDTAILGVLADLMREPRQPDAFYKELIGRLDMAIVRAGALGESRLDICHDIIARIQYEYIPLANPKLASTASDASSTAPYPNSFAGVVAFESRISKRPKRATRTAVAAGNASTTTVLPRAASRTIPRLIDPPSGLQFTTQLKATPFILPAYASDWEACRNWSNPQYLRSAGGLGRKVPVETYAPGEDYTSDSWGQQMMDWEAFLDELYVNSLNEMDSSSSLPTSQSFSPSGNHTPKKRGRPSLNTKSSTSSAVEVQGQRAISQLHYLAQHDLINQIPELRRDIIIPDYVFASPSPPAWFPTYKPPGTDEQMMMNTWIGPKGTVTPPHKDPYFNCYVQVVGKKTIWIAPPHFDKEMYPIAGSSSSLGNVGVQRRSPSVETLPPSTYDSPASGSPKSKSPSPPSTLTASALSSTLLSLHSSTSTSPLPTVSLAPQPVDPTPIPAVPAKRPRGRPRKDGGPINVGAYTNPKKTPPANHALTSSSSSFTQQTSSSTPSAPNSFLTSISELASSLVPESVIQTAEDMSNKTSRVPIFALPNESSIASEFPLFFERVTRHAMCAVLEPGDMLVIPPGWWHAMRSESVSASVSFWF